MGVGPGDPSYSPWPPLKPSAEHRWWPTRWDDRGREHGRQNRRGLDPQRPSAPALVPNGGSRRTASHRAGAAAQELQRAIRSGQQVALLCEEMRLCLQLQLRAAGLRRVWPDCPINVIPGITSCSAAAAGPLALALQQDQLLLHHAPTRLRSWSRCWTPPGKGKFALLKLGRRWSWATLLTVSLLQQALFAERVGWPDQQICCADAVAAEPALLLAAADPAGWEVLPCCSRLRSAVRGNWSGRSASRCVPERGPRRSWCPR